MVNSTAMPESKSVGDEKGYIALLVLSLLTYFAIVIGLVVVGIKAKQTDDYNKPFIFHNEDEAAMLTR